jgi:tetratricopeptide (TPR) repeat protein
MYPGDYKAAEPLMLESLKAREQAMGPSDPDTADSLYNLAMLYMRMNRFADAETYAKRTIEVRERAQKESAPVAQAYQGLAMVYDAAGRFAEAEPYYRRSLAMREKLLGPDHFEVANSYNNLGLNLMNAGRLDDAEQMFKHATAIFEKSLQPEHPFAAIATMNLGIIYTRRTEYAKAKPYIEQALKIQQKLLPPDHVDLARTVAALAMINWGQNDLAAAEAGFRRAVPVMERELGAKHPQTLIYKYSLGYVCRDQHKWEDARLYLAAARDGFRANRDVSLSIQADIAYIEGVIMEGKYEEGERMARALREQAEALGDPVLKDKFTVDAGKLLILVYDNTGRKDQADALRKELGIDFGAATQPATAPTTQP